MRTMSGFRLPHSAPVAALSVLVVLAAPACASGGSAGAGSGASATAVSHAHRPAPADPDLSAETERYYELVEGGHWPFAYAMLAPRYRAKLTEAQFEQRYASLVAPDVHARQTGSSTVVTRIDAKDAGDRTHTRRYEETLSFVWDGDEWKIDRIARRELGTAARI